MRYSIDLIGSGGTVNGQFTRGGSSHSSNLFTMDFDADEFTGQFEATGGNIVIDSGSSSSSGGSGSGSYTVEGVSNGVGTISESYSVQSGAASSLDYNYLPPSDIAAPDSATPGEDSQGSWELVSGETGSGFTASSGNSSSISGTWDQSNDGASSGLSWDINGTFDSSRSNSSESSESVSSTYNGQDWVESSESRSESLNTTSNSYDSKDGTITGTVGPGGRIDVTGTLTASGERTTRNQSNSHHATVDGATTTNESFTLNRTTNVSKQSSEISGTREWDYVDEYWNDTHFQGKEEYSYSQHNNVDELDETTHTTNFGVTTSEVHSEWDNSNGTKVKYSIESNSDYDRTIVTTTPSYAHSDGHTTHSTSDVHSTKVRNSSNNTDSFGSKTTTWINNGPETHSGNDSTLNTSTGHYQDTGDYDYYSKTTDHASGDFRVTHDWGNHSDVEDFDSTESRTLNFVTDKTTFGTSRDPDDLEQVEGSDSFIVNQVSGTRSGEESEHDSNISKDYYYDWYGEDNVDGFEITQYDTTLDYSGYNKFDLNDYWDSWYRSGIDTPGHNGVSAGYSAPSATGPNGSMQSIADADTSAAETVGGSGGGGSSVTPADIAGGIGGTAATAVTDAQDSAEENRVEVEEDNGAEGGSGSNDEAIFSDEISEENGDLADTSQEFIGWMLPDFMSVVISGIASSFANALPNTAQSGVGHHWVPVAVIRDFSSKMTANARLLALGNYSGSTYPRHGFGRYGGVSHAEYNKIVASELEMYMDLHGLEKMDADHMLDFSEKMRKGLDHAGKPNETLAKFNNAISKQRSQYLGGSRNRGMRGGRTKEDLLKRGASYRNKTNFIRTATGAIGASVLGAALQETVGALDVASKSQNFRKGMAALADGNLQAADRYFWSDENSFFTDLVDEGMDKAAFNFREQYIAAIKRAQADANRL